MTSVRKIGIIGAGISGLTSAYLLGKHHEVTLFEANHYFGGHTNTVMVPEGDQMIPVDTGFIVFNDRNYPLFCQLLSQLGVSYQKSEMSFSFSSVKHDLEYNGHNMRTLFAQKKNLLRPQFYRLLRDILRFHRDATVFLSKLTDDTVTLKTFIDKHPYDSWFWEVYLSPMVASIWSTPQKRAEEMSARFVLQFFKQHGLLSVNDMPQWLTIQGGSHAYVKALLSQFRGIARASSQVTEVTRREEGVELKVGDELQVFDQVIFACHSDTTLKILSQPTHQETAVLSQLPYQTNQVVLHTDTSVMPRHRGVWASWNYHQSEQQESTLTYYMNRLQNLSCMKDYFVSVNQTERIREDKIISSFTYEHPLLENSAISAQARFSDISGLDKVSFCGAYWFNGFHEDGVASAVRVCKEFGVKL